eukprot:768657-Hanusia_phi.AAC.16
MATLNKNIPFDDIQYIQTYVRDNKDTNIARNLMTKYELTDILSCRTKQISNGAHPFVNKITVNGVEKVLSEVTFTGDLDLRRIAIEELKQGVIPYIIKRQLGNNKFDYVRVRDMDLTAVRHLLY